MLNQSQEPIHSNKPSLTLDQVKKAFINWRRDPGKSARIPEPLWDQVIALLAHYPRSKVLHTLGISTSQLQKKLKDCIQQPYLKPDTPTTSHHVVSSSQEKFVKATVATPRPLAVTSHFHDVILTRSNGATLHIQQLQRDDMLKLVDQFVRDVT